VKKLWHYLPRRRQKQFYLLFALMIIASFSEVISIGAILPFLGALTAPEQMYQHHLMRPLIETLELTKPSQLLLPLTIAFIVAALLAGVVRLTLLYAVTRFSFAIGADLSINIYSRTLYQEYSVHIARNSSEIINGIINKTNTATGIVSLFLTLCSSIVLLIGVMGVLLTINIEVALASFISFGLLYLVVMRYTHSQLKQNSQTVADKSTLLVKSLQEGLGGIRDVLIDGTQQLYCQLYRNSDLQLRRASGSTQFIVQSPRHVMESIGMILIAGIAYVMTKQQGGLVSAVPVLGALALGAQRLLPTLQQAYSSYSGIKGARSSLEDILMLLEQPLPSYAQQALPVAPIPFEQQIELKNLSFRYNKHAPWVFKNINLRLLKGARIGFIGVTGSGKSTLLDVIMGLLAPTEGELVIDNEPINDENRRSWQAHIAHVPQTIYLSDSTIEENIAFGISKNKIDHQQVIKAAQQAQIAELIEQWQDGYQTFVGERGIRLSGGQRQRIGIARALYKQANVLIFDEATSALDNKTEQVVMEDIMELGRELTVLIIAHRLTTLKGCDQIISLDESNGICTVDYQETIN